MKDASLAALAGTLFGAGLTVSGMTRPEKVLGFLDVTGAWDASLAFVMIGAIGVHGVAYRLVRRRRAPLFAGSFHLPVKKELDAKLLMGAGIFGIGWGLGGFCPGPALVSAGALAPQAVGFVLAMTLGMLLQHAIVRTSDSSARRNSP